MYDNSSLPMLCIGDMNDILYDMDKNSPNINRSHMCVFRSLVKQCGLFDLGYSGPAYTWTNKDFLLIPPLKDWIDAWFLLNGVLFFLYPMFIICLLFIA